MEVCRYESQGVIGKRSGQALDRNLQACDSE